MPRRCSVCVHAQRQEIEAALIAETPYRTISDRYGPSKTALIRHKSDHLPVRMVRAKEAETVAQADDLLQQLKGLRSTAYRILLEAEKQGDLRTALAGIREARQCLELLAEMEGELDRRQHVNITLSPEWHHVRNVLVESLTPYPDARIAVAERLYELEAGTNGHRT